jgi:hypothetical protein
MGSPPGFLTPRDIVDALADTQHPRSRKVLKELLYQIVELTLEDQADAARGLPTGNQVAPDLHDQHPDLRPDGGRRSRENRGLDALAVVHGQPLGGAR